MRLHPVAIGNGRGLINERLAVADEQHATTTSQSLIAEPEADVALSGSGRGHKDLRPVAFNESGPKLSVGDVLKRPRRREAS